MPDQSPTRGLESVCPRRARCQARWLRCQRKARIIGMDIARLLAFSVKNQASDLHSPQGLPPMLRVHGDIRRTTCRRWSTRMLQPGLASCRTRNARCTKNLEVDFSFEIPEPRARFASMHSIRIAAPRRVFRTIPCACSRLRILAPPRSLPNWRSSRAVWCCADRPHPGPANPPHWRRWNRANET